MRVTYNWLKDYVEIKLLPEALAEKLTMAGLEVVSFEKLADDWVFEIEVTTNRPDWLSVLGVAREIAAITGKKLRLSYLKSTSRQRRASPMAEAPAAGGPLRPRSEASEPRPSGRGRQGASPPLKINIEDKSDCPRYVGRVIDNVVVRPSPDWLKKKLESVGLRPVNNIVDVTNFCLLETGQPIHAFDYDKLEDGTIIVRRANEKEKIVTIDGEQRSLDESILVIADKFKPVAIAGIMGGKDTEVNEATKTVLLESAYFDPVTIRKSARKLSLTTESSYRFERSVDLNMVPAASLRALDLIGETAFPKSGSLSGKVIKDVGLKRKKEKKIVLDPVRLSKILGKKIPLSQINRILNRLRFGVKKIKTGMLEIKIPSFRRDVKEDVDLIEEIARVYGYDKIPLSLAALREPSGIIREPPKFKIKDMIREMLVGFGLTETVSYSLVSRTLLEKAGIPLDNIVKVKNPLSGEQELLRPALYASLLNIISWNIKRKTGDLKIFELSRVHTKERGGLKENSCLCIALSGRRYFDWRRKSEPVNFYNLKGIIESIFRKINTPEFTFEPKEKPYFNPECSAEIKINAEVVGFAGELAESALRNFDLSEKVYLAELDLDKIFPFADEKKPYRPLPKYPAAGRDISFIVDEKIPYAELGNFFKENRYGLIKEINLVDVFKEGTVPAGKRSLTITLKFQSSERTLRDAEIDEIETKIRQGLVERFKAELR